ncbi:MAG: family transcriptional regulator [Gammaproteobacteria bacterium]|jgi:transcriptional regulator with XRE-family HTH domain|nr:family transcriptional regulator [Gammaproteobacteria bacterium]
MKRILTPKELEESLGEDIKALRLQKNIDRHRLCARAGVSENSLRNLEGGKGTTLKTLIRIIKALNREDWLSQIAPKTSINPLHLPQEKKPRQRARRKKHDKEI